MAEEPVSLELLQVLLERVLEGQRRMEARMDRVIDDLSDLKLRTTNAQEALAGVNRRLDRIDMRLERKDRRLDLADA